MIPNYWFHHFTDSTGQTNWSIIRWITFITFLLRHYQQTLGVKNDVHPADVTQTANQKWDMGWGNFSSSMALTILTPTWLWYPPYTHLSRFTTINHISPKVRKQNNFSVVQKLLTKSRATIISTNHSSGISFDETSNCLLAWRRNEGVATGRGTGVG